MTEHGDVSAVQRADDFDVASGHLFGKNAADGMRHCIMHMDDIQIIIFYHLGYLARNGDVVWWILEHAVAVDVRLMDIYVRVVYRQSERHCRSDEMHLVPSFGHLDAKFSCNDAAAADPWITCKDRKSTRLNSSHVAISYAV